eukprot:m.97766 g.97766  ORF g.97766 m.97766 type:complete len:97 (+) comp12502_c0_seq1:1550-1840(+)
MVFGADARAVGPIIFDIRAVVAFVAIPLLNIMTLLIVCLLNKVPIVEGDEHNNRFCGNSNDTALPHIDQLTIEHTTKTGNKRAEQRRLKTNTPQTV